MGIITEYLRKRDEWWKENFWKVDLALDVIFFAGLFWIMWYVITYDCSDVFARCNELCGYCNTTQSIINIENSTSGYLINITTAH